MSSRSQDFRVRNGWAPAYFPGKCVGCGKPFGSRDLITYASREGGWRATCCATNTLRDLVRQEETHGARRGT